MNCLNVGSQISGDICTVLTLFTLERFGNQGHYERSAFCPRCEDCWVNSDSKGVGGGLVAPGSSQESRGASVVFVLLKLRLGECGEGTLVTQVLLAVTVVLTLLLEVPVFVPLVLVEGSVPCGPPVTQLTLQPSLLMLGPPVCVEVGQVVGPVLTVLAVKDMLARVNLFMMSQPQPSAGKAGPAGAE